MIKAIKIEMCIKHFQIVFLNREGIILPGFSVAYLMLLLSRTTKI